MWLDLPNSCLSQKSKILGGEIINHSNLRCSNQLRASETFNRFNYHTIKICLLPTVLQLNVVMLY